MYFPEEKTTLNKLQFSAIAAASLMNLLRKQRDAFGLSLFDNKIVENTKCKSSTTHYQLLLTYLDRLLHDAKHAKTTATAEALHLLADTIHKRSLIVIFSDMFENVDNLEKLYSALQHLKFAKHEVILFHVTDKRHELEFEFENRPYEFIDMESGERIRLQSNQVKDLYVKKTAAYKDAIKSKCQQYKIDFVEADINEGYYPILQNYMVKRSKMK
jgi:uncharacterized protein (DUF58 family)